MWEFYTSLLVYLLRYQVTLTITAMKLIWWTMSMYIIACVDYESGDCVRVAWRRLISVMSMWSRNINNLYWSTLLICDRSPVVKAVYQYTKLIVLKHRWVFDPHRRKYFSYIFNYFISINTIIIIIIYINIAILPIALINVIKHLNKIVVTNNQNTFYYDSLIKNNTRTIIQRELKRNRIVSPLEIEPRLF